MNLPFKKPKTNATPLRMGHLDAALFALETSTNHMNLGLLATFDAAPADTDIAQLLRERLGDARYTNLRLLVRPSRVGLTAPRLVDGGAIDTSYHVQGVHLGDLSDRAVDEWVASELSVQLDRAKPLWQMFVLTSSVDSRFAVFLKSHHGVMDGVAALHTATQILDGAGRTKPDKYKVGFLQGRGGRIGSYVGGLLDFVRWPARVGRLVADPSRHAVRLASLPTRPLMFTAPRTALNCSISSDRVIARAELSLDELNKVRRDTGVIGTDVVIATVSSAVRRVLSNKGRIPRRPLVAIVPAAQTGSDWRKRSGNRVAFEFVSMATNVERPIDRLLTIAQSTRVAREVARLRGADLWERYAAIVPPGPLHAIATVAERLKVSNRIRPLGSLIVSYLTGPRAQMTLGGAPLTGLYPFGPPKDGGAINVTMLSYQDRLFVGVVGDQALASETTQLAASLPLSLHELAGSDVSASVHTSSGTR